MQTHLIQPHFTPGVQSTPGQNIPNSDQDQLKRETVFLSLHSLHSHLSPHLLRQILSEIDEPSQLPLRLAWDCTLRNSSFDELKVSRGHQNFSSLTYRLKHEEDLHQKILNFFTPKLSVRLLKNPISQRLDMSPLMNLVTNPSSLPYLLQKRNHSRLNSLIKRGPLLASKQEVVRDRVLWEGELFRRLKTVFGHANFQEGSAFPVYNCKFDQAGKIIITAADDGQVYSQTLRIIKVWDKETLILQASLHGHQDVIIDISVSKCNRYLASGSKDGVIIIWDLQACKIIKRLTQDHKAQVNSIQFVMIEVTHQHAAKNLQNYFQPSSQTHQSAQKNQQMHMMQSFQMETAQFQPLMGEIQKDVSDNQNIDVGLLQMTGDLTGQSIMADGVLRDQWCSSVLQGQKQFNQFLITCSDDGTINIYDVSSFSLGADDEFYTQGFSSCNRTFTVHSRTSQEKKQKQRKSSPNGKHLQTVFQGDESDGVNDMITRRTRKRTLVNGVSANPHQETHQTKEIFSIKLRPEEFRHGTRCKHIDSVSVNKSGFLAAGTNTGEVYLWLIHFGSIRKRKPDGHFTWINSFKLHKKSNYSLKFSPCGDFLMTCSSDGIVCLWDTSFSPSKNDQTHKSHNDRQTTSSQQHHWNLKEIDFSDFFLVHKFQEQMDSEFDKKECLVDAIEWSCNGRYAYTAISIKRSLDEGNNQNQGNILQKAVVKIHVFDTLQRKCIKNLDRACGLNSEQVNFATVIKCHPFRENILLGCFDGGVTILYDVKHLQIIQRIVEFGIYSIEQFTMNNALDVDFSSDGQYIAFSSHYGTLSLFSTQYHRLPQYSATRVQQFFEYDKENHENNPYELLDYQPQLCGFELNPYEYQPSRPVIGLHRNHPQYGQISAAEFQRQQNFAIEFAQEEEKFYQDQLNDGIKQGYFNNSQNYPETHSDQEQILPRQRLDDSSEIHQENLGRFIEDDDHSNSDKELLNGTSQRLERKRLTKIEDEPEDVEMSEFEAQILPQDPGVGDMKGDKVEYGFMASSQESNETQPRKRKLRLQIEEENIQSNRDQNSQVLRRRITHRRLRGDSHQSEGRKVNELMDDQSQISKNDNVEFDSSEIQAEDDESFEDEDEASDQKSPCFRTRKSQERRLRSNQKRPSRLLQSSDQSQMIVTRRLRKINYRLDEVQLDQDGSSSYARVLDQSEEKPYHLRRSEVQSRVRVERNVVKLREGLRQVRVVDYDETSIHEARNDHLLRGEIDPILKRQKDEDDDKVERRITQHPQVVSKDVLRDDTFSVRGTQIKKQGTGKVNRIPQINEIADEVFQLKQDQREERAICGFCSKSIEICDERVGPFEGEGKILSFHSQCLERNSIVKYNKSKDCWVNLLTALNTLIPKPHFCYRCHSQGATIQCISCDRAFHGHFCSSLYMMALDYDNINFSCIFCRNHSNFRMFQEQSRIELNDLYKFRKEQLDGLRKAIKKDHLFETKPCAVGDFYIPQVDDQVLYFFQGHEKFFQEHNCYFYCGSQSVMGSTDLPWMRYPQLRLQPLGYVVCQVVKVYHRFCSAEATKLVTEFGQCSSNVNQNLEVVTHVLLETDIQNHEENLNPKNQKIRFLVQIFPSECTQYLVPLQIYEHKKQLFQKHLREGSINGKKFKTYRAMSLFFNNHEAKVIEICPLEREIHPESVWENIIVQEVKTANMRVDRGRGNDDQDLFRINFWDLIYPEEQTQSLSSLFQMVVQSQLDELEIKRVMDQIRLFIQKRVDIAQLFLERVPETIAHDYKCFVSSEMWLNLIIERLQNKYYRSRKQLMGDVDLLLDCSEIYNGEDDELTQMAKQVCDKLKREIQQQFNDIAKPKPKIISPPKTVEFIKQTDRQGQESRDNFMQLTRICKFLVNFEEHESSILLKATPEDIIIDSSRLETDFEGFFSYKQISGEEMPVKRGRGRPRKYQVEVEQEFGDQRLSVDKELNIIIKKQVLELGRVGMKRTSEQME